MADDPTNSTSPPGASASGGLDPQLGLFGATMVGVGAMVGAGIFVLVGVAMSSSGPGAIVAFAVNGLLSLITAFAFAELASAFPEAGGGYVFARKVLPIGGAFAAGWTLWFAYVVACALYSLGFAAFTGYAIEGLADVAGMPFELPRSVSAALAVGVAVSAAGLLVAKGAGGGSAITVLKMVAFAILIVVGLVVLGGRPAGTVAKAMGPEFFPNGMGGLLAAMGFTFIALEGFEIVAAIAEEVKEPRRNIPLAMFASIGVTLVVYMSLLFVVLTVGAPADAAEPAWRSLGEAGEDAMAVAARSYAGPFGSFVVVIAGVLSTFSALVATLLAASRVSFSMARDRALPRRLASVAAGSGTPSVAVVVSAVIVVAVIVATGDVEIAGAAASLIFLLSFAFANAAGLLVRLRAGSLPGFKAPLYPLLPIVGITACLGLAVFQAVSVPSASVVVLLWLGLGWVLYTVYFRTGAETKSALAEALDENLVRLRGREPLVLVPLANPDRAETLLRFAHAIATPEVGRVLALTVAKWCPEKDDPAAGIAAYERAQEAVHRAVAGACAVGRPFEGVIRLAPDVGAAIAETVRERAPEKVVLGMSRLDAAADTALIDELLAKTNVDVAVLAAPPDWNLDSVKRILVPVGGEVRNHPARARVLGMLLRDGTRSARLLRVIPTGGDRNAAQHVLTRSAEDLGIPMDRCDLEEATDPVQAVIDESANADLIILGLAHRGTKRPLVGDFVRSLARGSECPIVAIAQMRH